MQESLLLAGLVVLLSAVAVSWSRRQRGLVRKQTAQALTNLAELVVERDFYTHEHSLRVGRYSERLALQLGQSRAEARGLFLCGRLHDLGKCAVSNDVLLKPGPLDPFEWAEMRRHSAIGAQMVEYFTEFGESAAFIRSHHEWYDGRGYPDGLQRSQIPLGARIIAVVDAYDAMTSDRPYRRALPHSEAVRRLLAGCGSQWDPRVVLKFLEVVGEAPQAGVQPEEERVLVAS